MADIYAVVITGRLTRDPERKVTQNGTTLCTFSMAVNSTKKDENGKYIPTYRDFIAYGKTAEVISKYSTKGSELTITGTEEDERYKDKAGFTEKRTKIIVATAKLGYKATKADEGISDAPKPVEEPKTALPDAKDLFGDELEEYKPLSDDELPF